MKIFWVVLAMALMASVFADENENNNNDEVFTFFGPFLNEELIKPDKDIVENDDYLEEYGGEVEDKNDEDIDKNNGYSFAGGEIMSSDAAEEVKSETPANDVNHEAGFTESTLSENNAAEVGESQVETPAFPEENTEENLINQNGTGEEYVDNNVEGTENTALNEELAEDAEKFDDEGPKSIPTQEGNEDEELPMEGFGTRAVFGGSGHSNSESSRHSGQNVNPNGTPMPRSFLDMFNHMMGQRGRGGHGSHMTQDTGDGGSASHHSKPRDPHHHHNHHHENQEHTSE